MEHSSLEKCNQSLAGVQERSDANPDLNVVRSNKDPGMLELFLLHFCAAETAFVVPLCGVLTLILNKALNLHAQDESCHY